ncbi:MAG: glycosyltransferase [Bacteroidota bacterium]|nr:glycosyltransferase [Bacteroidota bacterium]
MTAYLIVGLSVVITAAYVVMISAFAYGLNRLIAKAKYKGDETGQISVVVAAKNESKTIKKFINSLTKQTLKKEHFELILIDDHSEDSTVQIAEQYSSSCSNIRIFKLPEGQAGKKEALNYGVQKAKFDLITFTDADCLWHKDFLKTTVAHYKQTQSTLILGPVIFSDSGFLSRFQSAEFMSLTATTAGAANIGHPIMSNGANLTVEKKFFGDLNRSYASGDDMFLLHKIKKPNRNKISFLLSKENTVQTSANPSVKAFINQRLRWASKYKGYTDFDTIFAGAIVFALNLLIVATALGAIFHSKLLALSGLILLSKSLADLILEWPLLQYYKKMYLLPYFILWIPLYPIYSVLVTILSLSGKSFWWKGRKL